MSATVPGGPKTSYVRCLGLKGAVSLILVSAYERRFSEPKMPCSRDTVNPPAPITTSMTSGIHSRLRTLKIPNRRFRRLFRDSPRARGASEGWRASRRRVSPRPDHWLTSRRSAMATSDGACATSRIPGSTTPPNLPPVSIPPHVTRSSMQLHIGHDTQTAAHRMRWASQNGCARSPQASGAWGARPDLRVNHQVAFLSALTLSDMGS